MNTRFNNLANIFELIDEPEEKEEQPSELNPDNGWHYTFAAV